MILTSKCGSSNKGEGDDSSFQVGAHRHAHVEGGEPYGKSFRWGHTWNAWGERSDRRITWWKLMNCFFSSFMVDAVCKVFGLVAVEGGGGGAEPVNF